MLSSISHTAKSLSGSGMDRIIVRCMVCDIMRRIGASEHRPALISPGMLISVQNAIPAVLARLDSRISQLLGVRDASGSDFDCAPFLEVIADVFTLLRRWDEAGGDLQQPEPGAWRRGRK